MDDFRLDTNNRGSKKGTVKLLDLFSPQLTRQMNCLTEEQSSRYRSPRCSCILYEKWPSLCRRVCLWTYSQKKRQLAASTAHLRRDFRVRRRNIDDCPDLA